MERSFYATPDCIVNHVNHVNHVNIFAQLLGVQAQHADAAMFINVRRTPRLPSEALLGGAIRSPKLNFGALSLVRAQFLSNLDAESAGMGKWYQFMRTIGLFKRQLARFCTTWCVCVCVCVSHSGVIHR